MRLLVEHWIELNKNKKIKKTEGSSSLLIQLASQSYRRVYHSFFIFALVHWFNSQRAMSSLETWSLPVFILLFSCIASLTRADLPASGQDLTHHNHHNLFATKTTYHQAYHKLLNNDNQVRDYNVPDQCKPKMLYLICRHATRYPSKKKASKMQKQMYALRDKIVVNNNLTSDLIDRFKAWRIRMQIHDDNRITDTGFQETRVLGRFCSLISMKTVPTKDSSR